MGKHFISFSLNFFNMKITFRLLSLVFALTFMLVFQGATGQTPASKPKEKKDAKETSAKEPKTGFDTVSISALKFRSVGPAITSGRISEFAVVPGNKKAYYVASSAGGVWRTYNAGNTFEPIFDGEGSYSIGTITIDPGNSSTIWVGTGEANNQRSVDYGDGVYKSLDGGSTWKNMGLKNSQHIAKVIVDPKNSNLIYVAAVGPLWSAGGDRGVYRSKDGGTNWEQVLKIDDNTGACDLVMDPRNPNVMYAAAHQRRRHVFTYIGGGPQSTIYKTDNGGDTWTKSADGLPSNDIGRISLSISPANPDIIYAMVETSGEGGGVYKSTNHGANWSKQSGYFTAGNYFTHVIADPKDPNKVYSMDVWMKVSTDGGKSWSNVGEDFKHVDNHCMWIDPDDTAHFLTGCDGGVYETWDAGKAWQFKANLPVTQFYKVALDNATPFYNMYGGTQDNFSLGGPSRSRSGNGISNEEWFITHGGDGFESQPDPFDPNIVYAQSQYGNVVRYDKLSGEEVGIQPIERKGENAYRWNWDAPLVTSSHVAGRIYFAANKVFVSEDRGNNWTVISDDLTRQINRNSLKVMGRVWGVDAVAKNQSTSIYGNIVALCESPIDPNLIYVGTDDGLIQVTTDRGKTWKKIDNIAGAPDTSYVNMIIASSHDANVVYACFNHHKYGDFKPYLFVSKDKGMTWTSISANLPERGSVYSIAEDHVDPNLIFVGTEFGCYFTNTGGKSWRKLGAGLPTITVRDMAIQRRENDLVLATFGRGFYVLDDYSSLRNISETNLSKEAMIMPVRDAWSFEYSYPLGLPKQGFQGNDYYLGENLGHEALIYFYIKDKIIASKDARKKEDDRLEKAGKDTPYPTYDQLAKERDDEKSMRYLLIKDQAGNLVRKYSIAPSQAGLQRISWNLRSMDKEPASNGEPSFYNPFNSPTEGPLVAPGKYTVSLATWQNGEMKSIGNSESIVVKSLDPHALPSKDAAAVAQFKQRVEDDQRVQTATSSAIGDALSELGEIRKTIAKMETPDESWMPDIIKIENSLKALNRQLSGDPLKVQLDMDPSPSLTDRLNKIAGEGKYSSADPTGSHMMSLKIAEEELAPIVTQLSVILEKDMPALRLRLQQAGAPYTPNVVPTFKAKG